MSHDPTSVPPVRHLPGTVGRRRHLARYRRAAAGLAAAVVLVSCADDGKAEQDLTDDLITNHLGETDVIVNADKFPNFAHTCWDDVGFWSTTDRVTIIVYNDWRCPGSTREQPMTVLSGTPRDIVNPGG